jgi:hypothetical protein
VSIETSLAIVKVLSMVRSKVVVNEASRIHTTKQKQTERSSNVVSLLKLAIESRREQWRIQKRVRFIASATLNDDVMPPKCVNCGKWNVTHIQ